MNPATWVPAQESGLPKKPKSQSPIHSARVVEDLGTERHSQYPLRIGQFASKPYMLEIVRFDGASCETPGNVEPTTGILEP